MPCKPLFHSRFPCLACSGTNHDHDQPPHLRLRNAGVPDVVNRPIYAGPESRYCPAGVHLCVPEDFLLKQAIGGGNKGTERHVTPL